MQLSQEADLLHLGMVQSQAACMYQEKRIKLDQLLDKLTQLIRGADVLEASPTWEKRVKSIKAAEWYPRYLGGRRGPEQTGGSMSKQVG